MTEARAPRRRTGATRALLGPALLLLADAARAQPVLYTDEALFVADLATLAGSTVLESFEDDIVWAESRSSIPNPGSAPAVTSQGVLWTSNFPQNDIVTGTVGGSAPDGVYAVFSIPHGVTDDSGLYCDEAEDPIPVECWQNDGVKITALPGSTLFAFGGRIDTANLGKVSYLLDGVDVNAFEPDNIDNWQREGDFADNWTFVGVIDPAGFTTAELRELRGKDSQQVLLFADDFTIRRTDPTPPTVPAMGGLGHLLVLALYLVAGGRTLRRASPRSRIHARAASA
ncbi:MAG: hypothetical protein QNK04_05350 [Myxococcota bacterium]|nr:hypothetical protein [Myxococcota bacterium]